LQLVNAQMVEALQEYVPTFSLEHLSSLQTFEEPMFLKKEHAPQRGPLLLTHSAELHPNAEHETREE